MKKKKVRLIFFISLTNSDLVIVENNFDQSRLFS